MTSHKAIKNLFPEGREIFHNRIEDHSKYLFPLFTINLNEINPEWVGEIHMLEFNEDPTNTEVDSSFNEYCKDRMVGFDVIDRKYSFKTDFNYFALSEDWIEEYEATKDSYIKSKNYFHKNGKLPDYLGQPGECFEQIGGDPEWVQYDETPIDPDGNPMTFIARVYTSKYDIDRGGKNLYLFYSDAHKLAVILYQVT